MITNITVGRSSHCDIVVSGVRVSRVHAELSLSNGQYVYHDTSSNGSNIGGRIICNERVVIAPGTPVMMANEIPLPWDRVYQLLPPQGRRSVNDAETVRHQSIEVATEYGAPPVDYREPRANEEYHYENDYINDQLGVGWGILAFLIPIVGFILYFIWKDRTPHRANQVGVVSLIAFAINLAVFIL
jgi:pSer/pThr/pTyr-binding forkhead associated (FHA) protein